MMAATDTHSSFEWQSDFSTALLDSDQLPPQTVKTWNQSDPAVRFAVYRNNVVVNLIDGLCETFPVCMELVGEEFFRAMCDVFVRANPPKSRILSHYGSALPVFIDSFQPAEELPYLGDVARLESARVSAYHAADAKPMNQQDWANVDPAKLTAVVVTAHPSLHLLSSDYAVFGIWAAHQGACELADVDINEPEDVLIIRPELDVEVSLLPPGGSAFLAALQQGQALEKAAECGQGVAGNFDLATNLGILMNSGFAVSHSINKEGS